MATTYSLSADTRMEDLGLASGDTIALGGFTLTCETNLSAITGLYATGTGTIRMLSGGCCDFAAVPSTVTIEGGTEDEPLPAHGDYGYILRAAAVFLTRSIATLSAPIVSHCVGNSSRVQFAKTIDSAKGTITLDRDVDWEEGDYLYVIQGSSRIVVTVAAYDSGARLVTHNATNNIGSDVYVALATAGFVVRPIVTGNYGYISGAISGDELGTYDVGALWRTAHFSGAIDIGRLVDPVQPNSVNAFHRNAVKIGTFVSALCLTYTTSSPVVSIDAIVGAPTGDGPGTIKAQGGVVALSSAVSPVGRAEYIDCELPSTLYSSLDGQAELIVRTTGDVPTCTVHRAGGIATLVQRADFAVPTALPNAWQLVPIDDGTAWHDVPATVLPGETLTVQWYGFLGGESASAGVQILDGECPGFGQMAVPMGMAETLAEYTVPDGTATLRWLPVVQLQWRNTSQFPRKIVIRGWATGGTCYSRIGQIKGGIA